MAWLGLVALVGLLAVLFDFAREGLTDRRSAKRAAQGLPPVVWSWRKRLAVFGAPVLVLAMVGLVVALSRSSSQDTSSGDRLNVIPPTTTSSSAVSATVPGRPNSLVRVQVIDSAGAANVATTRTDALRILGYVMLAPASGAARQGSAVQCKAGFEKEAPTLARNVGATVTVEPFPTVAPANAAQLDCLVILGR